VVADGLGLTLLAVKQLTTSHGGVLLLPLVSKEDYVCRQGAASVSTAAIEKFIASYASLNQVTKLMGVHPKTASLVPGEGVSPVSHTNTAGIRLYNRQDIETFLRRIDAARALKLGGSKRRRTLEKRASTVQKELKPAVLVRSMLPSGEMDASQADPDGRSLYFYQWFNRCKCAR
jgi:DNA-binding transcriptional MerR regulator